MSEQGSLPPQIEGENVFELFPDIVDDVEYDYGQEYIKSRSGDIIQTCLSFGLNVEFVETFKDYLEDLRMIVSKRTEKPKDGVMIELRKSPNEDHPWVRCLILDVDDIYKRMNAINRIIVINKIAGFDIDSKVPVIVEQGAACARSVPIDSQTTDRYSDLDGLV